MKHDKKYKSRKKGLKNAKRKQKTIKKRGGGEEEERAREILEHLKDWTLLKESYNIYKRIDVNDKRQLVENIFIKIEQGLTPSYYNSGKLSIAKRMFRNVFNAFDYLYEAFMTRVGIMNDKNRRFILKQPIGDKIKIALTFIITYMIKYPLSICSDKYIHAMGLGRLEGLRTFGTTGVFYLASGACTLGLVEMTSNCKIKENIENYLDQLDIDFGDPNLLEEGDEDTTDGIKSYNIIVSDFLLKQLGWTLKLQKGILGHLYDTISPGEIQKGINDFNKTLSRVKLTKWVKMKEDNDISGYPEWAQECLEEDYDEDEDENQCVQELL